MPLILIKRITILIILMVAFIQCENKQKNISYDPSNPLSGKWIGIKKYLIENTDTIKILDSRERFFVLTDSIRFSYFDDGNFVTFHYLLTKDSLKMKDLDYEILELNKSSLITKFKTGSRYWISTYERN